MKKWSRLNQARGSPLKEGKWAPRRMWSFGRRAAPPLGVGRYRGAENARVRTGMPFAAKKSFTASTVYSPK
jgi:hypothetical protein